MGNDSLVTLTLDKSIANNPKSIAELIVQLADDIDSCKNDLSSIKDRGWWDKLTSNNTKDLASAMLKQNDTITLFLNIVQSIIMLHMHDTLKLGQIQEHLNMHEKSSGNFENKYTNMAKEFISQSYNAAISLKNKIENNEQTLLDIKQDIISKNEIDDQQTQLINQLRTDIDEHGALEKEQRKIIQELKNELLEHDAIDLKLKQMVTRQSEQTQLLFNLLQNKDIIDSKQDNIIKDIQELMSNYDDKLNNVNKQIDNIKSEIMLSSIALTKINKRDMIFNIALSTILVCIIALLAIKF